MTGTKSTQTAGFLVPSGRAGHQKQITTSHKLGEFLAQKNVNICCGMPTGEVESALVSGALMKGGRVMIYHQQDTPSMKLPAGGEVIEIDTPPLKSVAESVSHFWVLACGVQDLGRYLETWLASAHRPLVCLSQTEEFTLLRGFVEDIVAVDRPDAVEKIIFAKTIEEGWDRLANLMSA